MADETTPEIEWSDPSVSSEITPPDSIPWSGPRDQAPLVASPGIIAQRAVKADLGLGENSPGLEQLFSDLHADDTEQAVRDRATIIQQASARQATGRTISDLVLEGDDKTAELVARHNVTTYDNPNTILEELYSRRFFDTMFTTSGRALSLAEAAYKEDPVLSADMTDTATDIVARKEVFLRLLEDAERRWQSSPWNAGTGADIAEQFVPFLSWYRLSQAVPEAAGDQSTIGNLMRSRVDHLWSLPVGEAESAAREAINQLYDKNPLDALYFARSLVSFGYGDEILGHLATAADFSLPPGAGLAGRATTRFGRFLSRVVRSAGTRTTRIAETLDAAGETALASRVLAREVANDATSVPHSFAQLRGQVLSLHNPEEIISPVGSALTRAPLSRLTQSMITARDKLTELIDGVVSIPRVTEGALETGAKDAETLMRLQYPAIGDRVINVKPVVTATLNDGFPTFTPRVLTPANEVRTFPSGISLRGAQEVMPATGTAKVTRTLRAANEQTVGSRLGSTIVHEKEPNTDLLAVQLGKADGTLFDSPESAEVLARDVLGLKNYTIEQHGAGHFIQVTKPIDEASPTVRGRLEFDISSDQTNRGLTGLLRDTILGPEGVIPKSVLDLRKVAAYGTSGIEKGLQEVLRPFVSLSKDERKAFVKFANYQKDYNDPLTRLRGRFSQSQGEFEVEWYKVHGRMPTEKESEAYWRYVQLNDFDWVVRNMNIYRDKTRLGLEMFSFGKNGPQSIEGKFIASLPWNSKDEARVLVLTKDGEARSLRLLAPGTKKTIEELGPGYKVVQVSPAGQRDLTRWVDSQPRLLGETSYETKISSGFEAQTPSDIRRPIGEKTLLQGDLKSVNPQQLGYKIVKSPVVQLGDNTGITRYKQPRRFANYIVSQDLDTSKLPFKQIPYRPGGHVAYPRSGFFVSSPEISTFVTEGGKTLTHYHGDKNYFRFATRAQAEKFADRVNEGRRIALAGDDTKLADFLKKNFPDDIGVERFKKDFMGEHAFVRSHGKSLWDEQKLTERYTNLSRAADSDHNLYKGMVDLQYAQERNQPIMTIQEIGSADNPVFKLTPSPTLDPLATINSAASDLARGRYLDDLKFQNAERFVAEFHDILKADLGELRADPIGALLNAEFKKGVDPRALSAAKAFRRSAKEFLHVRSEAQEYVNAMIQRAADVLTPGSKIEEPWVLKFQDRKPAQILKSMAFHAYLGFLNVRQLAVQAVGAVNTIARSPLHGAKGAAVATGLETLLVKETPDMIKAYGSALAAAKIMRREHFIEAFNAYKRSGMWALGKEVAYREAMEGTNLVPTRTGYILREGSTYFFNKGERFNRATAWFTSYMEWRAANPTATLTDKVMRSLVSRADSFTVNMSQASKAWWERGIGSVPLQFLAYKARLMDQFVGKELTAGEKARMAFLYAGLWGVPIAAGSALPVWPWHSQVREWFAKAGANVDDSAFSKLFVEGLPGLLNHFITGGSGKQMNWGESFGPAGDPMIHDLLTGEKPVLEAMSGPIGSLISRTYANLSPLGYSLWYHMTGDSERFPLLGQDFQDAAASISTINALQRGWFAYFSGQYLSRGLPQTDGLSQFDSILVGALGLKPQELSDMAAQLNILQDREGLSGYRSTISRFYTREVRLGLQALRDDRQDDFVAHWIRARTYLEAQSLSPTERSRIISTALRAQRTLLEAVSERFAKLDPSYLEAHWRRIDRARARQGTPVQPPTPIEGGQ